MHLSLCIHHYSFVTLGRQYFFDIVNPSERNPLVVNPKALNLQAGNLERTLSGHALTYGVFFVRISLHFHFISFRNPEVGNVVFKVTQANGAPLPDWVKVDPLTNILTVADVPEAKNSNLTITIQKLVNGKLKKEARVLVNGSASSTE